MIAAKPESVVVERRQERERKLSNASLRVVMVDMVGSASVSLRLRG